MVFRDLVLRLLRSVQAVLTPSELSVPAEQINDIVLFVRPNGQIVSGNEAAQRMYGYSREELRGRPVRDLRAAGTHDEVSTQLQAATDQGHVFETMHRKRDGSLFPVEVSSRSVHIGGRLLLVSVIRDLSARSMRSSLAELTRQMDQRLMRHDPLPDTLQELCEDLAGLLDVPLVWIGVKQADGTTQVQAAAGRGLSTEGWPTGWDDTLTPDSPSGAAMSTGRVQAAHFPRNALPKWRSWLDEYDVAHVLSSPFTANELGTGVISLYAPKEFTTSVTQALTALASRIGLSLVYHHDLEVMRLQATALNKTTSMVVLMDASGHFFWGNQAWHDRSSSTSTGGAGRESPFHSTQSDGSSVWSDLVEGLRKNEVWQGRTSTRHLNERILTYEWTVSPIFADNGEMTHCVAVGNEVTDQATPQGYYQYLACYDDTSGALNARMLREHLDQALASVRTGQGRGFILVRLDQVQKFRDISGCRAFDREVRAAASAIQRQLGPRDRLYRLSNDEFAVISECDDASSLEDLAERLHILGDEAHLSATPFRRLRMSTGSLPLQGEMNLDDVVRTASGRLVQTNTRTVNS